MFIAYLLWAFSRISITLLVLSENNFRFQAPKNNSPSKSTFACRAQKKRDVLEKNRCIFKLPKKPPKRRGQATSFSIQ